MFHVHQIQMKTTSLIQERVKPFKPSEYMLGAFFLPLDTCILHQHLGEDAFSINGPEIPGFSAFTISGIGPSLCCVEAQRLQW